MGLGSGSEKAGNGPGTGREKRNKDVDQRRAPAECYGRRMKAARGTTSRKDGIEVMRNG